MKAKTRHHQLVACSGVLLLGAACGLLTTEPPSRAAELTGTITNVEARMTAGLNPVPLLRVLVEEEPGVVKVSLPQSKKAYFDVRDETTTVLIRKPDGGWTHGRVDDLKVGLLVSGWYAEGTLVLTSYPSQGSASDITVH